MNPFVAFLIIAPLIVSVVLTVGVAYGLVKHGPQWDIIGAFLILLTISGALVFLLKRTSKGALLEFPGSGQVDPFIKKNLTAYILIGAFLITGIMLFFVLNVDSLRNWVGVICITLGVLTSYSGISDLRQKISSPVKPSTDQIARQIELLETSLRSHGRSSNYLLCFVILSAVFTIVLYWFLDGARYLSIIDLAGFVFFLLANWIWLTLNGLSRQKKLVGLKKWIEE